MIAEKLSLRLANARDQVLEIFRPLVYLDRRRCRECDFSSSTRPTWPSDKALADQQTVSNRPRCSQVSWTRATLFSSQPIFYFGQRLIFHRLHILTGIVATECTERPVLQQILLTSIKPLADKHLDLIEREIVDLSRRLGLHGDERSFRPVKGEPDFRILNICAFFCLPVVGGSQTVG